jgi:hypothetical protein
MVSGRIRQLGYWSLEGRARREEGLIDETIVGLIGKLGLHWRKMKLEMGARAEQREREDNERDRYQCFLQVSRQLP